MDQEQFKLLENTLKRVAEEYVQGRDYIWPELLLYTFSHNLALILVPLIVVVISLIGWRYNDNNHVTDKEDRAFSFMVLFTISGLTGCIWLAVSVIKFMGAVISPAGYVIFNIIK